MPTSKCEFENLQRIALVNDGNRALLARDWRTALGCFSTASIIASQESGESDYYHLHAGAALWLDGAQKDGAGVWRYAVSGLMKRYTYSDAAGGAQAGLLLWFAGVRLANDSFVEESESLLEKKLSKPKGKGWPGPIASFVLGRASQDEMLSAAGTGELGARRLCQAQFYGAVKALAEGSVVLAREHFETAKFAAAGNTLKEIEYHLALSEIERTAT